MTHLITATFINGPLNQQTLSVERGQQEVVCIEVGDTGELKHRYLVEPNANRFIYKDWIVN